MIEEPTNSQVALARFLAIPVAPGDSRRAVAAKLKGALATDVLNAAASKETTEQQRGLAKQLGIKDLSTNRAVASSQIEYEIIVRNDEAMRKHHFVPGMLVEFIREATAHGHYWKVGDVFEVSSVKDTGRVFFKKTTGMSANASQLRPVRSETKDRPTTELKASSK